MLTYRVIAASLLLLPLKASSQFLEDHSYVAVKSRSRPINAKHCQINAQLRFEGAAPPPKNTLIMVTSVDRDDSGVGVVNDIGSSKVTLDKNGNITIDLRDKLPVFVDVECPLYEGVSLVLETCNVELYFYLAKEKVVPTK